MIYCISVMVPKLMRWFILVQVWLKAICLADQPITEWYAIKWRTTDRISFGVRRLHMHRLIWLYTCQNATLLEITSRHDKYKQDTHSFVGILVFMSSWNFVLSWVEHENGAGFTNSVSKVFSINSALFFYYIGWCMAFIRQCPPYPRFLCIVYKARTSYTWNPDGVYSATFMTVNHLYQVLVEK